MFHGAKTEPIFFLCILQQQYSLVQLNYSAYVLLTQYLLVVDSVRGPPGPPQTPMPSPGTDRWRCRRVLHGVKTWNGGLFRAWATLFGILFWCCTSHAAIFQLYMWRHRCEGGLKKKLYLRSGPNAIEDFSLRYASTTVLSKSALTSLVGPQSLRNRSFGGVFVLSFDFHFLMVWGILS